MLVRELEGLAHRLGVAVILDTGNFSGGACILEDEELIVLNKSMPLEQRARVLSDALNEKDFTAVYLKPAVRNLFEDIQAGGASGEAPAET